jgi:ABC-type multidrug transport system fused ATPase/permease subunit
MFLQSTLLKLSGDLKDRVAVGSAIGLGIAACDLGQAALAATLITRIIAHGGEAPWHGLVAAIAVLMIIRACLYYLREVEARKTGYLVKLRVRQKLFDHLVALGPGFSNADRTGNLTAIAVESVEHLEPYCAKYLPTFVVAVVVTIVAVAYIATLSFWLAAILLIFMIATPMLPQIWSARLEPRNRLRWALWSELASEFIDAAQGVTTLKLFGAAERKENQLHQKSLKLYAAQMVQLYMALLVESFTVITTIGGTALVVSAGALMVVAGHLNAAALILILLVCREVFKPWVELSTYWHLGINANSGAEKIASLLDEKPAVVDYDGSPKWRPSSRAPQVAFEDVSFTYPTRQDRAVSGVSFVAKPGSTVAIVGRSGSGKSTLTSLLLRFYDPTNGKITIDGADIRETPLHILRSATALVAQDTYLFAGTIRDNIRLGRPDATAHELSVAIAHSGLTSFIASLPEGLETEVGERGLSLSGGQRQRVAIARAFVKDAPILILDEATSNVDVENEQGILDALSRLQEGRTTIVIAHRLSTIRDAAEIHVLDHGNLVESGTHNTLAGRKSAYSALIAAQEVYA